MPSKGGSLFGSQGLSQIVAYNLVGQVVGAAIAPFLEILTQTLMADSPVVPLSPADLALGVIRNIREEGSAAAEARLSGVNAERFHELVLSTGDAPAPEALAEALRRGYIDQARYEQGIRQGRLRDEWSSTIQRLSVRQPSPEQALTALVEGQLPEDVARQKYAEFGGDPRQFDWLFGTVGAGPSPLEAATMAYRGVIPWSGAGLGVVSFEQAVKEGHSRNKWIGPWRELSVYLPPPRTITAMFHQGALTHDQAAVLLRKHGLPADLVAAYLHDATATKTGKHKELSESLIVSGYEDGLSDRGAAQTALEKIGYTADEATFILAVSDLRVEHTYLRAAIGRVHSAYVAHKIDAATATADLSAFKVAPAQSGQLIDLWNHERAANVRQLTLAQIEAAWFFDLITTAEAMKMLTDDGWSAGDANLLLEIRNKGPIAGHR